MLKSGYAISLVLVLLLPAMSNHCRAGAVLTDNGRGMRFVPSGDTIYQVDTVYQYVVVYDTLYYYDTVPETDTLTVYDTLTEQTDSAVVVTNIVNLMVKKKKSVFVSRVGGTPLNISRQFDEPEKNNTDYKSSRYALKHEIRNKTKRNLMVMEDEAKTRNNGGVFTQRVRDTIYRYDTVTRTETVFDTVFFDSRGSRADTSVSNYTEVKKLGSTVVVKETVNIEVRRIENVFVEKGAGMFSGGKGSQKPGKKSKNPPGYTALKNNRWKRELKRVSHARQNNRQAAYSNNIKFRFSMFKPSVVFTSQNTETASNVGNLNKNTKGELSFGGGITLDYFWKNAGFETGFLFSRQNFAYTHHYLQPDIDTSYFWEYFHRETYFYDTTWYINIDTLLQTGDTLLMPNVDSTAIVVTDSAYRFQTDTTFVAGARKYPSSFTYIEIPVIAKFSLLKGKYFINVSVGVLPGFLIAKSGDILSAESGSVIPVKELTFDSGFSLSAYGALDLGVRISGKWAIHVEPYLKMNIFSALKNDYLLMRTNTWGADFGISYRLF